MSFVYPRYTGNDDPEGVATDQEVADTIIFHRETGCSKIMAQLNALAECHNKAQVKRVSDAIDEEIKAASGVNPLDYSSGSTYLSEVTKVLKYLTPADWVDGMKEKYDVDSFAELKAKLTPAEE